MKMTVVAIAGILSALVMFGLFCENVAIGSLRFNLKAPWLNVEYEMRKDENSDL